MNQRFLRKVKQMGPYQSEFVLVRPLSFLRLYIAAVRLAGMPENPLYNGQIPSFSPQEKRDEKGRLSDKIGEKTHAAQADLFHIIQWGSEPITKSFTHFPQCFPQVKPRFFRVFFHFSTGVSTGFANGQARIARSILFT
ncbi:MAG: hypothetical protein LIO42_05990 [Oscillospiraceae bacterium]|nr:hypothetical protein [Oscillospiraceae bacterium]